MRLPIRLFGGLVMAAVALGIVSCSGDSTVLRIQTNIPALANLTASFMAEPGMPVVEVEYREELNAVEPNGRTPDLIIGTGLYSNQVMENLASQEELFTTEPVDTSAYYPFTFIKYRDDVRLTVLSWDLPTILSPLPENGHDFNETVMMPIEGLMDRASQYNKTKKNRLSALGFSPLYNDEFMYLLFQYHGTQISADNRGYPEWREDRLTTVLQLLAKWSMDYNGGAAAEASFVRKFAYAPVYQLLASQRFSYAYSRASDFLAHEPPVGQELYLHWASWQNRLLILDNMVGAGIPQQSNHKSDALRFIRWLLTQSVQNTAIVANLDAGLHSFGFLGGFSSCRVITEKIIPQYYPAVRLRIPPESMLDFPQSQGMLWTVFKNEIFAPWVRQQLIDPDPTGETLRRSVSKWLLQLGLNP